MAARKAVRGGAVEAGGSEPSAPRRFGRRLLRAWLVATLVSAAFAGLLAGIALARARYPILDGAERLALAARWSAAGAVTGAALGLPLGLLAAATGGPGAIVGGLGALALAGASVSTRGSVDGPVAGAGAPGAPLRAEVAPAAPAALASRPNLVLFTIDTLRADHLDAYGYPRATAPAFARLAAQGVLFETAIAQAPATQLSMASLLTGLWPWSHADPALPVPPDAPFLRSGFETLAERLAAAGFDTGGFVANPVLRSAEGYAQGFARFDQRAALGDHDARVLLAPALEWLAGAREPFFLWVHAMDPHHPYDAPELAPWEARDGRDAELRAEWQALPLAAWTERLLGVGKARTLRDGELAMLVGRYDAEIRHADAALARLLEALEARGAGASDTWIVITSDHGEEFADHGEMTHGHTLFDELLRVPLVVRGPGAPAGLRVPQTVRGVDVAPTLLEAAGLPADGGDGRSLAPLWTAPGSEPERPALSSRDGKYLAYRTRHGKLVVPAAAPEPVAPPARGIAGLRWMARVAFDGPYRPKSGYWSLPGPEPLRRGVAPGRHAAAREAQAALEALRRTAPPRPVPFDAPARLDPELEARLRALGYAE